MNIVRRLRAVSLLLSMNVVAGCGATAVRPGVDGGTSPADDAAVAADVGLRGDVGSPVQDGQVSPPRDVPSPPPLDVPSPPRDVPSPPLDAEPLTSCDPANDGRRCGPVGSGCGGGGGGVCSPSSMCVCGRDQRWSCSVTVPSGCDGGVSPADAGPAPVCALSGTWRASFGGESLYFVFTLDGRWSGRMTPDGPALVEGTYTLAGEEVTIGGEMGMSGGGCASTDRGLYRVQFRANCAEMSLALLSEDCAPRGNTLSMLSFSRL